MKPGDREPPGGERPGPTDETGPIQQSADTTTDKPMICHPGVAGWLRRRRAAQRLVPLDCGCRDPWPCRCSRPPLSEKMVDGYRDAAQHLHALGLLPAPLIPEMQALWRRGGTDRRLMSEIAERWELAG